MALRMTGTPLLAFDSVTCLRGDRLLFETMSFVLDPGAAALVTGPNGSGKSSLLRLAAGLLTPFGGSVSRSGKLAWLDDRAALDANLPLGRALAFWASIDRAPRDAITRALATMDIERLADVPVRMLSTGQRRRAGLARVLLGGAAIWLLDEPGNGLDSATLARLADAVAHHRADGGIVIAATHQPLGIADPLLLELAA